VLAAAVVPSGAQPATETHVLSNFSVLASNGFTNLPEFSGSGDGVVGAECTGASPFSGTPNIPSQMVTYLRTDLTHMRVFRPDGRPYNGDLRVNCVLEVESGEPAARWASSVG
jgi:hypothetical protein